MPEDLTEVYIFFTTHWDREWYLPFEKFRIYLIDFINKTLELINKYDDYPPFYLDGQFIPIEDYLEIYPEKEKLIKLLCSEKRLYLGPWYTMPDTNIINGESIFRNLEIGIKGCLFFNVDQFFGFLSDIFGHNSQIPQILNLFDIDTALLWRGIDYQTINTEFYWCYPEVNENNLNNKFIKKLNNSKNNNNNNNNRVYNDRENNNYYEINNNINDNNKNKYKSNNSNYNDGDNYKISHNELQKRWFLKSYLYNMEKGYGDAWIKLDEIFQKNKTDNNNKSAIEIFDKIIKERLSNSIFNIPLIQIGVDHCYEDEKFYNFFKYLKSKKKYNLIFDLGKYFENFSKIEKNENNITNNEENKNVIVRNKLNLKIVYGELRKVAGVKQKNYLIPYIGSSRIDLKRLNHKCENTLIYNVEPLIVILKLISLMDYNLKNENNYPIHSYQKNNSDIIKNKIEKYIKLNNYSWKMLIKNHAHDSIGGCSIDSVHKDMIYRFNQIINITSSIIDEIKRVFRKLDNRNNIFYSVNYSLTEKYNFKRIRIFNTLQSSYNDYIELNIRFIKKIEGDKEFTQPFQKGGYYFQYEKVYLFDVIDSNGDKIDYDILEIKEDQRTFEKLDNKLPTIYWYDNYKILLNIKVNPFTFTDYFIIPAETPSFYNKNKFFENNSIENKYLKVYINNNGTITVFDKEKKIVYNDLLKFRIDTDIGDGYNFYKPINGSSYYLNNSINNFEIKIYKNKTSLILNYSFKFNRFFDDKNIAFLKEEFDSTLEENKVFQFQVIFNLYKEKKFIDFKTVVNNNLKNIRFSVYFPFLENKNDKLHEYYAYTPYDIVKRKFENVDDKNFTEPIPEFGITNGFIFIKSINTTALFSKGNPEVGVFKSSNILNNSDKKNDKSNSTFNIMGVTLFRSFSKTVFTNGESDGLMLGKMNFEYSLRFYKNEISNAYILNEYLKYINNLNYDIQNIKINNLDNKTTNDYLYKKIKEYNRIVNKIDFQKYIKKYFVKRSKSLLDIQGTFVINSIRVINENVIFLRGFNPEFEDKNIKFKLNFKIRNCYKIEKLYNKYTKEFVYNILNNIEDKKLSGFEKKLLNLGTKLIPDKKNYFNINIFSKEIINLVILI